MDDPKLVLDAIKEILPKEISVSGKALEPKELYIPIAHKKALELYSNIIIGDRGVGKSTWTLALADSHSRALIDANIKELENTEVHIGFAEAINTATYPDKTIMKALLRKKINPKEIWKAVVIRWLSQKIGEKIPVENWLASVEWVRDNAEPYAKILEKANNEFKLKKVNGLILFDALDRLSDNWDDMDNIARELLRLISELKAFTNIYAKVFLRKDQLSRPITNFPDASKLLNTRIELDWEISDLHGLLWQQLCNASDKGGDILREYYKDTIGILPEQRGDYWVITDDIKRDEPKQRALFQKLAGPWMGKDKRKGIPYVWSVGHLADGKKHTSPRSFLAAIRTAAEDSMDRKGDYPLHYESIKRGVQSASKIRVAEIAEDYPWINDLCTPLAGKNVPILFHDIEDIWKTKYPDGLNLKNSEKLPPQDKEKGWIGYKSELVRLGIFVEMSDNRMNMPDLFRVGFGLGRKGGVPPVG
jgi:hypothetical protein